MNEELIEQYENLTMEAVSSYNSSSFEEALNKFLAMSEANPNNSKVLEIIVRLYLKLDRTEDAKSALGRWKTLMEKRFPGFCAKKTPNTERAGTKCGRRTGAATAMLNHLQEGDQQSRRGD